MNDRRFARLVSVFAAALLCLNAGSGLLRAQQTEQAAAVAQRANQSLAGAVKSGLINAAEVRQNLTARYASLEQIYRNQPGAARSYTLDAATRDALVKADPSNAALLEQEQPVTGELAAVVGDDFAHGTSTMHYMLHTAIGVDYTLSFVNSPDANVERMLHHQVTVFGMGLRDMIAVEILRSASAAETRACNSAAADARAGFAAAASTGLSADHSAVGPQTVPAGAATASCSQFGNQTTAIIILNFTGGPAYGDPAFATTAYWNNVFNGAAPSVAGAVSESSYGQTSAVADVYGPITLPQVYDCTSTDAMATAAYAAAVGTVDFTRYNRYILVYPVNTCNFGGLDTLSCLSAAGPITHQYSTMWLPVTTNNTTAQFTGVMFAGVNHEYGHALGLNHGNTLDFGALTLGPLDYVSSNPGTVNGTGVVNNAAPAATAATPSGTTNIGAINTEYGDFYSGMGNPWTPAGPYSAQQKAYNLGWLAPSTGYQVVTASGNYSVAPEEATTGVRALQVLRDPTSSSWVWVEYHQPLGTYEPLMLNALQGNGNNNTTGVQMRYQDGLGKPLYTLLMTMAPTTSPNNFFTSNLVPGSTWSDPFSLLTITAGTQTAASMPVTVSYDTPCATVALSASSLSAAAGTGTVNITAPASCTWNVSSNANWISFTGATTGTGNATVGFSYTANTTTSQRNSYITAQRQSLAVVQGGTGINLVGLTPVSSSMAPTVLSPYTFTIADALGANDFAQLTATFVGGSNPDCVIMANSNGTTNSVDLTVMTGATTTAVLTTGNAGSLSTSACTVDGPGSSVTINGNTVAITLAVSFPAAYLGTHTITAQAFGQTLASPTLPVGYANVATTVAAAPGLAAVTVAPNFGNQGTTVPVTFTGTNTSFSAATTVTLAGPGGGANGITVTGIAAASATSLSANLVIPSTATIGAYTVTVTTGGQTATTTFNVMAAPTPTVTISPTSGTQSSTVPFTLTGINTNFTAGSTVVVGGTGVSVTGLTFGGATTLTGSFVIAAGAATGQRTVTITSGTEVDTVAFTVLAAATPTITVTPASGSMGSTVPITVTGTNTAFTNASTVTFSGQDVAASNIAVASATSLTANVVIANTADPSPRTLTVTSGAEVDTAVFTVLVAPTPSVALSPLSGSTGSTVPITVVGKNTSFSAATTVGVSGTGITVNSVVARDAAFVSANLIVAPTATPGNYTVTITTGTQVVTATFTVAALTATKTTLTVSPTSVVPAQAVSLGATVAAQTGNGTPGGQVSFLDQTPTSPVPFAVSTQRLTAGAAALSKTGLSIGTHTFSLQYMGDTNNAPSNSTASISVVVAKGTPGVVLSGVPTATLYPNGATGLSFTAVVSGGTTGVTPTGTVTFSDGANALSTVNVNNGSAVLTGVTLATGAHSITAAYNGDGNFNTLTTAAQTVAVQDFTLSPQTASVSATGTASINDTITLTPGTGGFTAAIALACSGAPANSTCTVSPSSVAPGTTAATATVNITTVVRPAAQRSSSVALLVFGLAGGLFLSRRRSLARGLQLALLLLGVLGAVVGCSSNNNTSNSTTPGTAAGTYTLTITGQATGSTTLSHTTTITLVVN